MMQLYSLDPDYPFALTLATSLATPITAHEYRHFEDGEHKLRPLLDPVGGMPMLLIVCMAMPCIVRTTSYAGC